MKIYENHCEIAFTNSSPSTMTIFFPLSSEAAAAEVGAVSRCCLICSNSAVVAVVVFLLHWAALVVSESHLGLGQDWLVDN